MLSVNDHVIRQQRASENKLGCLVMMHPDSKVPTDEQRKLLADMLHWAFVEIRALGLAGHAKQAVALADAFHNLPQEMWRDYFSVGYFREAFLAPYLRDWPRGPFDYLAMLHKVEQLQ